MTARALARVLDPIGVEEFATSYCARRPLLVRGTPSKFHWLLDERRLRALLLDELATRDAFACRIDALEPGRPDRPLTLMTREPMAPAELDARLAAGLTVCITRLSADDAALRAFVDAAVAELRWAGDAWLNCYVSPPASGADLHWDAQITTTLQIAGRKRWRYATRSSLQWPRLPAQVEPSGRIRYFAPLAPGASPPLTSDELEFDEVVLGPGDLLCLPAGTLHEAKALDPSIALNLALGRPTAAAAGGATAATR